MEPLSPIYHLVNVTMDSPLLKDAFPGYQGGGVIVPPPLVIGDLSDRNTPEAFYLYERFGP